MKEKNKFSSSTFLLIIDVLIYLGVALIFFGSEWGHALVIKDNVARSSKGLTAIKADQNCKLHTNYDGTRTKSITAKELWRANKYPAYPSGRMSIPVIDIHNPLFEGFGEHYQNLSYGVCTAVKGRKMGADNNYVLAGHYMGGYGSAVLDNLHYVHTNDLIYLTDMHHIFVYKSTTKSYSVSPTNVNVEDNIDKKSIITLITCSDFNTNKYGFGQHRTIVQGKLVGKMKATKDNLIRYELADGNVQKKFYSQNAKIGKAKFVNKRVSLNKFGKINLRSVVYGFTLIWGLILLVLLV